jgi:hypothetical protein
MVVSSPSELIAALIAQQFDHVLDTPESEWLDFKEQPYQLDRAHDRWELAKDVASFANTGAGYIVVGVASSKHAFEAVATATQIVKVRKDGVDVDAYRKIIRSVVYPSVQSVTLKFYPDNREIEEALFVIEVIPQDPQDRPFILRKALDEVAKVRGAIGIPFRDGDQTEWWSAERIHELIGRRGQRHEGKEPSPALSPEALIRRVGEITNDLEDLQDWEDIPVYSLAAVPGRAVDLVPRFYGEEGLARLLGDPPSLRPSGFNIDTYGNVEPFPNGIIARVSNKALRLETDGVLVAAVPGDRSFLQWGINDGHAPSTDRINTLTLVEFTYEYFRFVESVLGPRAGTSDWTFVLEARRFQSAGVVLDAGVAKPGFGSFPSKKATSDSWTHRWEGFGSAGRNAAEALTYFYALFERGAEDFDVFLEDGEVSASRIIDAANSLR